MKVKSLSRVRLFATPWTVAHQAPPSMGFSRQEYWSGVPSPSSKSGTNSLKYFFYCQNSPLKTWMFPKYFLVMLIYNCCVLVTSICMLELYNQGWHCRNVDWSILILRVLNSEHQINFERHIARRKKKNPNPKPMLLFPTYLTFQGHLAVRRWW